MNKMLVTALAVSFCIGTGSAQLIVVNTVTAEEFVDFLLGDGIDVSGITFTGDLNQIGSFDSSNSNILIETGVMMASGDCEVAIGPNNSGSQTTGGGNFGVSDPDLDQLSTFNTNDATVLEFDFVASGDSIKFFYTFGSEEYNEYVCGSVNDAFGFFLSGPGIDGPFSNNAINLAIIPDTDIPVTINTVNLGVSGTAGTPANCEQVSPDWDQNTEYYVDNEDNGDANSTQMDGFTVVLTAQAGGLQCGETYHIKMAIADAGDTAFDSCVFLEEGSFESNSVAIETGTANPPELGLSDDEVLEGCSSGWFTIYRPDETVVDTVQISLGGTAENGTDYITIDSEVIIPIGESSVDIELSSFYDNLDEGDETVDLFYTYIDGCGDTVTVDATLVIKDYIGMTKEIDDVWLCQSESETVSGLPEDGQSPFSYVWTPGGNGASATFDIDDPGPVTLVITDFCDSTITTGFNVTIADTLRSYIPEDFYCFGETTGFFPYDGAPPYEFVFDEDSLNISDGFEFTANYSGTYTVTAIDQCDEDVSFELIFISCETMIPNVFTPNSDGKNDAFSITGIAGFPGSSLEIYNRWGIMIYSSVNYNNTWDGEDHAAGTYFYIFTRSDGEIFTGHLSLFR
jgi:gliding motility-associated-like protein